MPHGVPEVVDFKRSKLRQRFYFIIIVHNVPLIYSS